MKVLFTNQFEKDIRKIKNRDLARNIENVILSVKNAPGIGEINNLRKLKGYQNAYRIRIGDYRMGIYINEDVVEFACFMNRKEIYRYFP